MKVKMNMKVTLKVKKFSMPKLEEKSLRQVATNLGQGLSSDRFCGAN